MVKRTKYFFGGGGILIILLFAFCFYLYWNPIRTCYKRLSISYKIKRANPEWKGRIIAIFLDDKQYVFVLDCSGMKDFTTLKGEDFTIVGLSNFSGNNVDFFSDSIRLKDVTIECEDNLNDFSGIKNVELLMLKSKKRDVSILKELVSLKTLFLFGDFSDISFLENMPDLERLGLHSKKLSDLTPIKTLNKLKVLKLRTPELDDISLLSELGNLESLWIYESRLSRIPSFDSLKNLRLLDLESSENIPADTIPARLRELDDFLINNVRLDTGKGVAKRSKQPMTIIQVVH